MPDQLARARHDDPSPDAFWRVRRCGPIWLTLAAGANLMMALGFAYLARRSSD
jgi:hypothetical protein